MPQDTNAQPQAAGRTAITKFKIVERLWTMGKLSFFDTDDVNANVDRALSGEFDPLPDEIAMLLMEATANDETT